MPPDFLSLLSENLRHLKEVLPELLVAAGFLCGLAVDLAVGQPPAAVPPGPSVAPPPAAVPTQAGAPAPHVARTTGYILLLFLLLALWVNVRGLRSDVEASQRPSSGGRPEAGGRRDTPLSHAPGVVPGLQPPASGLRPALTTRSRPLFSGMVARDAYGRFFKTLLLVGTAVTLLLALHARELQGRHLGEFLLLTQAVCLGGMFLCSATNLLMIYLALESLSIISYALAGFLPQDRKSAEAGIKYAIYGALASGLMIFGMSYLYGLTGTLDLHAAARRFQEALAGEAVGGASRGALFVVFGLLCVGFLYKIAAVPFHYWSPDVYEGAPTTATAFFSVVPKAAGFAVLLRVVVAFFPFDLSTVAAPGIAGRHLYQALSSGRTALEWAALVLSLATMTLGNLAALGQTNAKRMLAYSSIAHAGYMLAGLTVLNGAGGAAAVLYYLAAYLVMNLGAFLALVGLENQCGGCELDRLRGGIQRQPLLGAALVVCLFSLVGMPPLAGFAAKYVVMLELAGVGDWFLVLAIGINSVISLYYYMRLAKAVAMDPLPVAQASCLPMVATPPVYQALAICHMVGLGLLFVFFQPVLRLCRQVLESL